MSNRRAVPALVEAGERLAPTSTVGQTPEAPSPSDDASASGPTSRCAGKGDWGGNPQVVNALVRVAKSSGGPLAKKETGSPHRPAAHESCERTDDDLRFHADLPGAMEPATEMAVVISAESRANIRTSWLTRWCQLG